VLISSYLKYSIIFKINIFNKYYKIKINILIKKFNHSKENMNNYTYIKNDNINNN
jgi:hypothetical protein